MKSVFKALEPFGYEQEIVSDAFEVVEPYTEIFPIQPCLKSAFDFEKNQWYEMATDEEIARMIEDFEKSKEAAKEQEELIKDLESKLEPDPEPPKKNELTNKELIDKLKEFPLDATVTVGISDYGYEGDNDYWETVSKLTIKKDTDFELEGNNIHIV